MNRFVEALEIIAPLFIVISVGIAFGRSKLVSNKWVTVLNDYSLWLGFPALIFSSLSKTKVDFHLFGDLIIWNSAYILLCIFLAFPISRFFRLESKTKQTLVLALAYGNVSYLGIPVLLNAYGNEIMPVATMISAVYVFWLFTVGIYLVEKMGNGHPNWQSQVKSLLLNPLLIAVMLGLVLSFYEVKIPAFVMKPIDLFGNSVTAVVLFSLGIFLGKHPLGKLSEWIPVTAFSMLILVILPAIFYFLAGTIFDNTVYRGWILDAAMPMGLTSYILAVKYELNISFASKLIVISTVLAAITLPIWIIILG